MRSFPFYRQHDAMQCGIACLRMICAFLGKNYSIDSLSKICFASKDGVSLLGISEAAGIRFENNLRKNVYRSVSES